jgi:hypothetical protein
MVPMMKKIQKINLMFFLLFVAFCTILLYVLGMDFLGRQEKPWHLQPSVHEDSLSVAYTSQYQIYDKIRMIDQVGDSSKRKVLILVDAWGVPTDENLLAEDFSLFAKMPHKYGLHQRLANRTKHAELVEYRNNDTTGLYMFGGDSLEYDRNGYIPTLGYREMLFCDSCSDSVMTLKLDSVLVNAEKSVIAWTTQDSRLGNRGKLHRTLTRIAALAKKYPDVQFIVQGAHRPILGMPEIRRMHKSHWVPVVILN